MILLDLVKTMADDEVVEIVIYGKQKLFVGTAFEFLNNIGMKSYYNNIVINCYSLPFGQNDSIIKIFISNRKSDRELVKNLKVGMIKNAIGLSDIGFMTYLNYLNITISMLYSFDVISKNEYDYLLKYISNVEWDILCKKEV